MPRETFTRAMVDILDEIIHEHLRPRSRLPEHTAQTRATAQQLTAVPFTICRLHRPTIGYFYWYQSLCARRQAQFNLGYRYPLLRNFLPLLLVMHGRALAPTRSPFRNCYLSVMPAVCIATVKRIPGESLRFFVLGVFQRSQL